MSEVTYEDIDHAISACRSSLATLEELVEKLQQERDQAKAVISFANDERDKAVEALEKRDTAAIAAVHQFLDEVKRPAGALAFDVPTGFHTSRAILGMFDAVERNP